MTIEVMDGGTLVEVAEIVLSPRDLGRLIEDGSLEVSIAANLDVRLVVEAGEVERP